VIVWSYLIVDSDKPRIVHHARSGNETILMRIVSEGTIALDPRGLKIALPDVYEG
jgi:hypothetical protein